MILKEAIFRKLRLSDVLPWVLNGIVFTDTVIMSHLLVNGRLLNNFFTVLYSWAVTCSALPRLNVMMKRNQNE